MEEKRLIERNRRGGWRVLFLNSTGLETKTIEQIFSKYGSVTELRYIRVTTGINLITYRKYEDAQRAVEGIKIDHPEIKLLYHKKRNAQSESSVPAKMPEEEGRPGLVEGRSGYALTPSSKVVPAVELVFGNMHPSLDVYYLLHLLSAYEPVAISHIHPTKRYCLVYLKSNDLAAQVEQVYDGQFLAGKKLVVLRTKRLLQEFNKV